MSGYALSPEPGTIRLEHVLSCPVEEVWAYLTQDDKRGSWLARGIMELERGGLVALTWRHEELSPHEEVPRRYQAESGHYQEGHVTRLEAPRLLGFSWGQDGEVVFALTPEGDGTRLTLTHRRIEGRPEMVRLASSWHVHLQLLDDVLAGRERRP
ncbi:MAG TPA: SRPBCC family protein, partial [Ancylobacter sp.]